MSTQILQELIVLYLVVLIPVIIIFLRWKKINKVYKIVILTAFLLSSYFIIPNLINSFYLKPVSYEIDLSQNQAEKVYEMEFRQGFLNRYLAGFEIFHQVPEDIEFKSLYNSPWPSINNNDIEIIIDNKYIDGDYGAYDISDGEFVYGVPVSFSEPFKNTKLTYKINNNPPEEIKKVVLSLEYSGMKDFYVNVYVTRMLSILFMYGSILVVFVIRFIISRMKKTEKV